MRVFFCGNGSSAVAIARYLHGRKDAQLVGCAIHPEGNARESGAIARLCGEPVVVGDDINTEGGLSVIRDVNPQILLSVHFGYILKRDVLQLVSHPINVHPAYLPHGRGAHPNVWALVEEAPAGVTIHYMTERLDAGDILLQREVSYDWLDTAETLYQRLLKAEVELFLSFWPLFAEGRIEPRAQASGGSFHAKDELIRLGRLDLDQDMPVRAVLNRLRARTFPPYDGCFIEDEDGSRTYFRLVSYRRAEGSGRGVEQPEAGSE